MKEKKHIITHIVFIAFSFACVIPVLTLISTSLTEHSYLVEHGVGIFPGKISLDAYKAVFRIPDQILKSYGVSIFITIVGTISSLLMSAMAAYTLSRPDYKYRNITSFFLYFTVLFSGGLVSYYILITQYLGLKDSIWSLILPSLAGPWLIFLLRTFFRDVPISLFEAARLDGASEYWAFFRIMLPLSKPALATAGFMMALGYWNDWYNAMLFIDNPDLRPIQQMLQQLNDYIAVLKNNQLHSNTKISAEVPSDGVVAATCLIAIGPMLCVFMLFQKYFIRGITSGAVKE